MAVGETAGLLLAGGAFSATSSIMAGNQQATAIKRQSEYNAQVYEQQAEMIKEKKKIENQQFLRNSAFARGKLISQTAGKGFLMSGSPLAILIDNETQMQFDEAINQYNLDIEKNVAYSSADSTRQTGINNARVAAYSGYSNAFSTMLNTGINYSLLNTVRKV